MGAARRLALIFMIAGIGVPAWTRAADNQQSVFDAMHRAPNYKGPFSPIVLTNFSVYTYWGDDEGKELFTRNVVQTGPRTFSFNLKSMGQGPNSVPRAELLAKDRAATQVMTEKKPDPISLAQKAELDSYSERIESERTVYVEFNREGKAYKSELISLLKLVSGDMPITRGPERQVLESRPAPLPWMMDPVFSKLAAKVRRDSAHEQMIYEFSRGMNIEDPELFRYSYAFLLRRALEDTLRRGGDIRKAYIYGHTVKAQTTAYFTKHFPWKRWDEAEPYLPTNHAMFRSSIADLIGSSDLYEYFDDWKQRVDALTPGDPLRYFLFQSDAANGYESFFKVHDARTGKDGVARLRYPKSLIDLRIKVACAKHNVSCDLVQRQIMGEDGYQDAYHYYGEPTAEDAPKAAQIELFPPKRINGAQGLYDYVDQKYDLEKVDLSEAGKRISNEYARLLKEWKDLGRPVGELGFGTERELLARTRATPVDVFYEYRLHPKDANGDWNDPERGEIHRRLGDVKPLADSELRLRKLSATPASRVSVAPVCRETFE